jgi:hypothetical protein
MNIDVSKWKTEITKDVSPPTITYINSERGIEYTVHDGFLNYVEVYPSQSQLNLECQGNQER